MDLLNLYGLLFVILLLIPNIVYGLTHRGGVEVQYHNKLMETLEQVGRFGCMFFMIFQFPWTAYCACGARNAYLILGGVLMAAYWLGWVVFWKSNSMEKALILSILPALLFLESALLTWNIPLLVLSAVFGVCHITISCNNAS